MNIEFETPIEACRLPYNYLPAAFAEIQGPVSELSYPFIPVPLNDTRVGAGKVVTISGSDLADPKKVSKKMGELDEGSYFLGPPGQIKELLSLIRPRAALGANFSGVKIVGIIDTGIAFWNPAFYSIRKGKVVSQFEDIGFLDFSDHTTIGYPKNAPAVNFLGQKKICELISKSKGGIDEEPIIAALADEYPGSVYFDDEHAGRLYDPNGMNHGTMVADLAAHPRGSSKPGHRLFAIELPAAALLDSSGDTLQSVIAVAIEALIARVLEWAEEEVLSPYLNIILSYAFLGGPHDGNHPSIRNLEEAVANSDLGEQTQLFLPMGNHRQDQAHVQLPSIWKEQETSAVGWVLCPDDHSANTIEICCETEGPLILHLASPAKKATQVELKPGDISLLKVGTDVIGAAFAMRVGVGMLKIRLTLAATSRDVIARPVADFGEWTIKLKSIDHDLKHISLWALREDGNGLTRRLAPRRQSYFEDHKYERHAPSGGFYKGDPVGTTSTVRRAGSASLLSTSSHLFMKNIGAQEELGEGDISLAWYSGGPMNGNSNQEFETIDKGKPSAGQPALGNGGPRLFKVSGTSVAAAKKACADCPT